VLLGPLRLFLSILPIVDGCKPMSVMQKKQHRNQLSLGNTLHTTQRALINTHLMLSWDLLLKAGRYGDLWEQVGTCDGEVEKCLTKKSPEGERPGEYEDEEELDFAILSSESSSFFSVSQ
jgi:hypothetical protein